MCFFDVFVGEDEHNLSLLHLLAPFTSILTDLGSTWVLKGAGTVIYSLTECLETLISESTSLCVTYLLMGTCHSPLCQAISHNRNSPAIAKSTLQNPVSSVNTVSFCRLFFNVCLSFWCRELVAGGSVSQKMVLIQDVTWRGISGYTAWN